MTVSLNERNKKSQKMLFTHLIVSNDFFFLQNKYKDIKIVNKCIYTGFFIHL